ncbi:ABC transporter substrate-binding protein [Allostreptomyces psammosilenae]|uniref:Multiple sugar transport system substrate-binding protein n=1 Tax=Allostreptomyces psammosilenae TaxID=1892865 RepID=A0A852ZZN4_9ACTN|nr:ABC transporter substrate-binding protein [Allostreptomyces psammosilenae]NYI03732.1 multiple sugar transport system substrate-binding protein [Allostreptomyces psammosilenae]
MPHTSPRTAKVLAAATAVVLSATACGSGSGTGTPEAGPAEGTITWYAMPFGPAGLPEKLVEAFEAAHPEIDVEFQAAPNNTDTVRSTLTTEISGGSSSVDVYNGDVVWPAQFGQASLALSVDDYLPADFWERFAEGRAEGTEYAGSHVAVPLFTDQGFLVYRQDLLEQAGLPVPTTWEELRETAKRLQDSGAVEHGYVAQWANYEGLTVNWTEFAADADTSILNPDATEAAIDSPESLRALEFMRSLIEEGVTPAATTTFQEQQAQQLFTSGGAAFLRNWGYAYGDANDPEVSEIVGKVGITTLPTFEGQQPPGYSAVGGWNLMINPHTDNLGATMAFVEWMTGPQAQRILAENSMIPAVADVLNDPELQAANPVLAAAAQTRLISRPSATPEYPRISQSVYTNVNAALTGTTAPATALAEAQARINDAVSGDTL